MSQALQQVSWDDVKASADALAWQTWAWLAHVVDDTIDKFRIKDEHRQGPYTILPKPLWWYDYAPLLVPWHRMQHVDANTQSVMLNDDRAIVLTFMAYVLGLFYLIMRAALKADREETLKNRYGNDDTVYLYVWQKNMPGTSYNMGAWAMKTEFWLAMSGLPYQVLRVQDTSKSPTGQIPYMMHKGKYYGDSELIINHLTQEYKDKLAIDRHLTPAQAGLAVAVNRLCQNLSRTGVIFPRWLDPLFAPITEKHFVSGVPLPIKLLLRYLIFPSVRRSMVAGFDFLGYFRHVSKQDVVYSMAIADVRALAGILGQQAFMLGAEPSSADCVAAALLLSIRYVPQPTPVYGELLRHANLLAYLDRFAKHLEAVAEYRDRIADAGWVPKKGHAVSTPAPVGFDGSGGHGDSDDDDEGDEDGEIQRDGGGESKVAKKRGNHKATNALTKPVVIYDATKGGLQPGAQDILSSLQSDGDDDAGDDDGDGVAIEASQPRDSLGLGADGTVRKRGKSKKKKAKKT